MRKIINLAAASLLLSAAGCGDKGAGDTAVAKPAVGNAKAAVTPTRDWTQVTSRTPGGGFLMGNPDAKVKFLEFASLTCPHCRDFNKEATAGIRAYVATGKVSYEFRNFVLNGPDYAVTMLARCQTPSAYFRIVDQLYGDQENWIKPFLKPAPEMQAALAAAPDRDKLLVIADSGKIADFFRMRGMSRVKYEECLRDEAGRKKIAAIAEDAQKTYNLTGTPTFVLNGETKPDLHIWPDVDKAIKAMLG